MNNTTVTEASRNFLAAYDAYRVGDDVIFVPDKSIIEALRDALDQQHGATSNAETCNAIVSEG